MLLPALPRKGTPTATCTYMHWLSRPSQLQVRAVPQLRQPVCAPKINHGRPFSWRTAAWTLEPTQMRQSCASAASTAGPCAPARTAAPPSRPEGGQAGQGGGGLTASTAPTPSEVRQGRAEGPHSLHSPHAEGGQAGQGGGGSQRPPVRPPPIPHPPTAGPREVISGLWWGLLFAG
jgi:hypothetical protein